MAIKQSMVTNYVCDICGEEADGGYFSTGYLNGRVAFETSCPHDFCKKHMEEWFFLCGSRQEIERYDGSPSDEKRAEMLNEFKGLMGED